MSFLSPDFSIIRLVIQQDNVLKSVVRHKGDFYRTQVWSLSPLVSDLLTNWISDALVQGPCNWEHLKTYFSPHSDYSVTTGNHKHFESLSVTYRTFSF